MLIAMVMLTGASLVAAYTDLARRRVPNVLTFGLAAAVLVVYAFDGVRPVAIALAAYLIVLLAGMIPFSRGWMGGGDVKLLAAGAACAGWPGLLTFLFYVALTGGALALLELARAHRLRSALTDLAMAAYVGNLQHGVVLDPERRKLPYAVAIAAGALLLLASETCAPWLQLVHA